MDPAAIADAKVSRGHPLDVDVDVANVLVLGRDLCFHPQCPACADAGNREPTAALYASFTGRDNFHCELGGVGVVAGFSKLQAELLKQFPGLPQLPHPAGDADREPMPAPAAGETHANRVFHVIACQFL